ncbi:hypothetical protein PHLGIDRAFT_80512 [Phlebiopsis gigantea 11061_1 CR5-6]|uniref:Uncharacterized protein n=1 Tax=Phlebiopsis gigantea (strain 11061_1 CR5-6) TaxID=745531 RepID=A0A0C3P9T9_PHLG1|nr:hypothetical protein PHLGIDRAFT_80512 [Phlebiopsis gigantea 11061_1 CR5-6]
MKQNRGVQGHLYFPTFDIPPGDLEAFGNKLREQLKLIPTFQDSFFLHEWRGIKGGCIHDGEDDEEVDNSLDQAFDAIDISMLTQPLDPDSWYVDIGLEIQCPGHIVQWLEDAHTTILHYALPQHNQREIRSILRSPKFHVDTAALLYDLAGFRTEVTPKHEGDSIVYLNVYTTDKSVTYQLHTGAFRRHKAEDTLPSTIGRLIQDMETLGEVWDTCAGSGKMIADSRRQQTALQQYNNCGYRTRWCILIEKTKLADDEKIRAALLAQFKLLVWMPWGKSDRMWTSGKKETGHCRRLPEGGEGSAVKIALNPSAGVAIGDVELG